MLDLQVLIPGEPMGAPRTGKKRIPDGKGGFTTVTYDPPAAKSWKGAAREPMRAALKAAGVSKLLTGPLRLDWLAVFHCPASKHLKRGIRPAAPHTVKPDSDNVEKLIKDASNKVLWQDDKLIWTGLPVKITGRQGQPPFVWMRVREAPTSAASQWLAHPQEIQDFLADPLALFDLDTLCVVPRETYSIPVREKPLHLDLSPQLQKCLPLILNGPPDFSRMEE